MIRESWTILVGLSIIAGLCGCAQQDSKRTSDAESHSPSEETQVESETSDDAQKVCEMPSPEDQPSSTEAEDPEVVSTDEASGSAMPIPPPAPVKRVELPSVPAGGAGPQSAGKVRRTGETTERRGYCATFRDAARRTAQISYDLNYQGPAMFFSWPAGSDSEKFDERPNYLKDLRRAEESDEDLITVIQDLGRYSGAKRIHLIAHSMGNFLLTEALKTIDDRLPANQPRSQLFDQVVMAAPDINAREFVKRTGLRLKPFSRRITVYASTQDKALWVSRKVNGYEPLGFLNEFSQGGARSALYDLVDASQFTTGWFDCGHIYYGDMPEVLHDLGFIFRGIQAASLQRGLAETPPMYRLSRRSP